MKIAVSGSSGFIGSCLVRKLKKCGFEVISLDRQNGIDLTIWEQLVKIPQFDVFVHLASKSFVPDSYNHPRDFYATNITGTLNSLELCRIHGARMLYTSSYVYGAPKYLPVDEKHPVAAFNPYAQTKLIGEKLCEGFNRDFGVPVQIMRPFNVYGLGQKTNFLIPTIIDQAKTGKVQLKDPNPKRDFIFVDDLVEAYLGGIRMNEVKYEVFNIGSGVSFSVREIVQIVNHFFGDRLEIEYKGSVRPNEISDTVADITKATQKLDWSPKIDLNTGIEKLLEELEN